MKSFITTLVSLVIAMETAAAAYPIEPRPLRKLISESEYILIGHVIAIEKIMNPDNAFDASMIARIKVQEVLKGRVKEEILEVAYNPGYICPAPPYYEANTDVLLFLDRRKGTWYTHALSYGAKTLPATDLAVYKSRILEMKDILRMQESDAQFFEIVEWLVKCVEHPATRWEGTYELSPESDFMSYYARAEFKPFQSMLSQDQRERLKTALFTTKHPGYEDIGLIDLVYRGNEQAVHDYLLNTLKQLPENGLFYASEYMERLLRRKSTPEMERLAEEFENKRFETQEASKLKTIIYEFVTLAER